MVYRVATLLMMRESPDRGSHAALLECALARLAGGNGDDGRGGAAEGEEDHQEQEEQGSAVDVNRVQQKRHRLLGCIILRKHRNALTETKRGKGVGVRSCCWQHAQRVHTHTRARARATRQDYRNGTLTVQVSTTKRRAAREACRSHQAGADSEVTQTPTSEEWKTASAFTQTAQSGQW